MSFLKGKFFAKNEQPQVAAVPDAGEEIPAEQHSALFIFLSNLKNGKKRGLEIVPRYEECDSALKTKVDGIVAGYDTAKMESSLDFGADALKNFESVMNEIVRNLDSGHTEDLMAPVLEGVQSINTEKLTSISQSLKDIVSDVGKKGKNTKGWLARVFNTKSDEEFEIEKKAERDHEMEIIESNIRSEAVNFIKCQYSLELAMAQLPGLESMVAAMEANRDSLMTDLVAHLIAGEKILHKLEEEAKIIMKTPSRTLELSDKANQISNLTTQLNTLFQSTVTLAINGYKGVDDVKQNIADTKNGLQHIMEGMSMISSGFTNAGKAIQAYHTESMIQRIDQVAANTEEANLNSLMLLQQQINEGKITDSEFIEKSIKEFQTKGHELERSRKEIERIRSQMKVEGEALQKNMNSLLKDEIKHATGIDIDEVRAKNKSVTDATLLTSKKPAPAPGSSSTGPK